MIKRIDPVFILLSIFLFWKVVFLLEHNHLSPDGAVIGLMARHILEGQFPAFFYGYGYIGSLKSIFAAGLFALFGATEKVLLLLPALFYIGFVWTTYWLVVLIADRKAARIAMLLTLLSSHWLTLFSAEIVGGYMDTLFYGNLLLIFLTKFYLAKTNQKWLWSLVMGFVGGLAFWQFPLSGYYLVTVGLCLFVLQPRNLISIHFPLFLISFFVGSAPFWVYNLNHHFISFGMVKPAELGQFFAHLVSFLNYYTPALLGWGFQAYTYFAKLGWGMIVVLFFVSLLWLLKEIKWPWKNLQAPLLLLFLISWVLFSRNNYVGDRSPMVALPLLFLFPAVIGIYLSALSRHTKILFWGALLILVSLYGNETRASLLGRQQNATQFRRVQNNFLSTITSNNVKHLYAPYAITPLLSFNTEEKISLSQLNNEAIPGYQKKVTGSLQPGFLFIRKEDQLFEENLVQLGCDFKKESVENHSLFFDILKTKTLGKEISPKEWLGPKRAFDRDLTTRWSTYEPQKANQVFEVNLQKEHLLSGLEIRSLSFTDLPRALRVEVSRDRKTWEEVCFLHVHPFPLYWSGTHPFADNEQGRMELTFPPTRGRFVRLIQRGNSDVSFWSLHELFLYESRKTPRSRKEAKQELEKLAQDVEPILSKLLSLKKGPIYTDSWLTAQLSLNPKAKELQFLPLHNSRIHLSQWIPSTPQLHRYIEWEKKPIFVIEKEVAPIFEKSPLFSQMTWEKDPIGSFIIYKSKIKEEANTPLTEISSENWKAEAQPHSNRAKRIFKENKWWGTQAPQKKGMFFLIDLGKKEMIQKIEMEMGYSRWEYPKYFEIWTSSDKENWKKTPIQQLGVPYWDGRRILNATLKGNVLPIQINPTEAHYVKIVLTKDFSHNYWSLGDIRIYQ